MILLLLGVVLPGTLSGQDSRLVSGPWYYEPSLAGASGHPYWGDPGWKEGFVILEGRRYDSLPLKYNLVTGQLILSTVRLNGRAHQLVLHAGRLSSFSLDGHLFVPEPSPDSVKGIRFCEQLTAGPLELLHLQTKSLRIPASGTTLYRYESHNQWLLRTSSGIIPYRGIRTLTQLFPDQRQNLLNLKRSLRKQFPRNKGKQNQGLVHYCNDHLNRVK